MAEIHSLLSWLKTPFLSHFLEPLWIPMNLETGISSVPIGFAMITVFVSLGGIPLLVSIISVLSGFNHQGTTCSPPPHSIPSRIALALWTHQDRPPSSPGYRCTSHKCSIFGWVNRSIHESHLVLGLQCRHNRYTPCPIILSVKNGVHKRHVRMIRAVQVIRTCIRIGSLICNLLVCHVFLPEMQKRSVTVIPSGKMGYIHHTGTNSNGKGGGTFLAWQDSVTIKVVDITAHWIHIMVNNNEKMIEKNKDITLPWMLLEDFGGCHFFYIQSAFLKGQNISDNVVLMSKIAHKVKSTRKGNTKWCVFKMDIQKAYDELSWSFIEAILRKMHFPSNWIQLIMQCITTISYNLLINGNLTVDFQPSCGIRQGDPISSHLYILCANVLSCLNKKEVEAKLWRGIMIGRGTVEISHLMYADDTMLFFEDNLPTNKTLRKHHIPVDEGCSICIYEVESREHVFLNVNSFARDVWFGTHLALRTDCGTSTDLRQWFNGYYRSLSGSSNSYGVLARATINFVFQISDEGLSMPRITKNTFNGNMIEYSPSNGWTIVVGCIKVRSQGRKLNKVTAIIFNNGKISKVFFCEYKDLRKDQMILLVVMRKCLTFITNVFPISNPCALVVLKKSHAMLLNGDFTNDVALQV
ncbi:ribonuclease H [Senna tora]|uniref:Ribonuclease H n=1 Tax=Senna tora TaxID=362788 RepID=A0A834T4Z3_9FABA|nr:ribonuclease H [Senna tora]